MSMKKVLMVDDSATARHELGEILSSHGMSVIFAEDGETGEAKAKSEKPDLAMMDIVMPGMNGFQATHAITHDPETSHIPVIICTTKGLETDKIWGMRQGAKDYVVKPIAPNDLMSKIAGLG
ncbi:MAG: response regulator transcription factor [Gallionellaceae bacterium]